MFVSRSVLLLAGVLAASRVMEVPVIMAERVETPAPSAPRLTAVQALPASPAPRVETPAPPRLLDRAPALTGEDLKLAAEPLRCDEAVERARARWVAIPGEATASQILAQSRRADRECRFLLLAAIDDAAGRRLGDDRDWLPYLVEWKLPQRLDGVGALSGSLQGHDAALLELAPDERDRLTRHRSALVPNLLRELESSGSASAAFLLALLDEQAAAPLLARLFIERSDFYGFETSTPDPLQRQQYPAHHAYEEALRRLTGLGVEEAVPLSPADLAALLARDDEAAFYVLSRLAPAEARALAGSRFRAGEDRVSLSFALVDHLLTAGLAEAEVKSLLGEPREVHGDAWIYPAGEQLGPVGLLLTFERGALASAELVETGPLLSDP